MRHDRSRCSQSLRLRAIVLALVAVALVLVGCGGEPTTLRDDDIGYTEEQQIMNLVEDFYMRQEGHIPEYEATIEAIEGNWARVSIAPVGVDNVATGPDILYLQNQVEADNPLPTPTTVVVDSTSTGPVATDTGWVIIAGPQAQFTEDELSRAGVPAMIRH